MRSLFVALCVLCASCTGITPFEQQLINCESSSVQSQLGGPSGLEQQAMGILNGNGINSTSLLNDLLSTQGPAVVCAVQAAVQALEGKALAAPSAVNNPMLVAIDHGNAWLASDGHYKLVVGVGAAKPKQ